MCTRTEQCNGNDRKHSRKRGVPIPAFTASFSTRAKVSVDGGLHALVARTDMLRPIRLCTGILHKLPVNFGKEIASMRHVYDLYDVQDKSKRGQ